MELLYHTCLGKSYQRVHVQVKSKRDVQLVMEDLLILGSIV